MGAYIKLPTQLPPGLPFERKYAIFLVYCHKLQDATYVDIIIMHQMTTMWFVCSTLRSWNLRMMMSMLISNIFKTRSIIKRVHLCYVPVYATTPDSQPNSTSHCSRGWWRWRHDKYVLSCFLSPTDSFELLRTARRSPPSPFPVGWLHC